MYNITTKISEVILTENRDTFSCQLLKKICEIIYEFVEDNDLHNNTDKLKDIIVKFDESTQHFMKAKQIPNNIIVMEEF